MKELDITRRTIGQARRAPQWQRLIDSIHKAQGAKGVEGRQFGRPEMAFFGETLIGMPAEKVAYSKNPTDFAAYWVARQTYEHSDGSVSVRYVLKAVYGDDLAQVHTISASDEHGSTYDPAPEWESTTARQYVEWAHRHIGRQP